MTVEIIIRLTVLIVAALATGALMVNWIGLARAMARMPSGPAYTELHQAVVKTYVPYMPIVVVGALLGGIALAFLPPGLNSAPGVLAVIGVLCYAAVIGIGLTTDVPINNLVLRWQAEAPPGDWALYRARWIKFHILRTLFSVPALAAYILSSLLR
jgi:Domain of unknown function (DUF1772)